MSTSTNSNLALWRIRVAYILRSVTYTKKVLTSVSLYIIFSASSTYLYNLTYISCVSSWARSSLAPKLLHIRIQSVCRFANTARSPK